MADVRIDPETARMVGELLGGVAAMAGRPEAALVIVPAATLAARLCDGGYEVPSVDALRAKAAAVAALPDLPEGGA